MLNFEITHTMKKTLGSILRNRREIIKDMTSRIDNEILDHKRQNHMLVLEATKCQVSDLEKLIEAFNLLQKEVNPIKFDQIIALVTGEKQND